MVASSWRAEAAEAAGAEHAITRDAVMAARSAATRSGGGGNPAPAPAALGGLAGTGVGASAAPSPSSALGSFVSAIGGRVAAGAAVAGGFIRDAARGLADIAGKIWTLPNTVVGLVIGLAGLPFGARMRLGNNAIQFLDFPLGSAGEGLTLGNVQIFPCGSDPVRDFGHYYGSSIPINLGLHEEAHTYHAQVYGPFFLPAYFLSGGISAKNRFEQAANRYALGGGWWP